MEFLLLYPELDGEGVGRRVQDGEHMHTHGGLSVYGKTNKML